MRFKVLMFTFLLAVPAFAAHPLSTDDAGTVEMNKFELETGFDNCKDSSNLRSSACGFSIKHGISEKVDVGISFPYSIDPAPVERFGSASLGIKFLLVENTFAVSLSNDLGSAGYFINGIYSVELSKLQIHANLGYTSSGNENIKGETSYSSALVYPLT